MTQVPARLVVRRAASRGTLVLASIAALAGLAALWVVYELGRYEGGYDMLAAARQRSQLLEQTAALDKQNGSLRRQIARLETMRVGREQERAELARTIGALQSQVASQAQQLTVFRGLVSHGQAEAELGSGLEIQELHITADSPPGRFEVHLMLLETAHPQTAVTGTYQVSVEGRDLGKSRTLQFAALTGSKQAAEPFSFRYFQSVQVDIDLPSGFAPEHLTVELRAGNKQINPVIQTFPWKVDAS
jgi:Family of unknown function (DUF6776)